jgi:hypothetical protein
MREGWNADDYLILFDEAEVPDASSRYGIVDALPGFQVIGLRGWDDFLVRDAKGGVFTIPTVPLDVKYLAPFTLPCGETRLREDRRFTGKIKWYVKPVAFGGDPKPGENLTWVDHEQHAQLVRWWHGVYRGLVAKK